MSKDDESASSPGEYANDFTPRGQSKGDTTRTNLGDTAPPDDGEPIVINGYTLQREVSRGGQAVIFLATQNSTGRRVALKFVFSGRMASAVERARMDQEVRILAALDHPNIVSIIDRGSTADGSIYFVMAFVEGRTLSEFLDAYREKNGQPHDLGDPSEIVRLFIRICDAINAAHLRGIVHRDIKPSNIIIDTYGEPHILDFGLARNSLQLPGMTDDGHPTTQTGQFVGSIEWASPEQAEGAISKIDTRSDVYSLGVILYEMLTSEFPYEVFASLRDVLNNIVTVRPVPPSKVLEKRRMESKPDKNAPRKSSHRTNPIPPELDQIVMKALAKSREERHQSAGELSRELSRFLANRNAMPQPGQAELTPMARAVWIAGTALVLVAIGIIIRAYLYVPQVINTPANPTGPTTRVVRATGYRIEGSEVTFEFNPHEFDVVRTQAGVLNHMSNINSISSVKVAGGFNGWEEAGQEWEMELDSDGTYRLQRTLSDFGSQQEWLFKFRLNDDIWVSAPHGAVNREVVLEDSATYNLVFTNPDVLEDATKQVLRLYRSRIDKAWPGQGANLVPDGKNGFQFDLTHLPGSSKVISLEALRGVPLSFLHLGDNKINDLGPLLDMKQLSKLVMNQPTYGYFVGEVLQYLYNNDFTSARKAAETLFSEQPAVPALIEARQLISDSVDNMEMMRANPKTIPSHAGTFDDHHYAVVIIPRNWRSAAAYAEEQGAHLATVNSREERDYLINTYGWSGLGRSYWIGGTDEDTEGRWRWTTSEPWYYQSWGSPEPNNFDDREHHLGMKYDGWWIDADGENVRFPFILEWDR